MVIDYSVPAWFYPILFWTLAWKAIASWRAARKGHLLWFIVFFILNTFGILPILYIFFLRKVDFYTVNGLEKKRSVSATHRGTSSKKGTKVSIPAKKKGVSKKPKMPVLPK